VIWKLRGVCRTQSCDPPHGLEIIWGMEIIWGLKISKLLNLIAYLLACLLTCTNWVLSCICERLAKHASRISIALFEMMLAILYMLVLVEIGVFMLVMDLLNLLIHFLSYLNSWLLDCCLCMISRWGFTLVFASFGKMVEYSCLNTCLYTLWSTLILISCIASPASLGLCLMSSLPMGERMSTKLVELVC
jgi:hypothetical protein